MSSQNALHVYLADHMAGSVAASLYQIRGPITKGDAPLPPESLTAE
jgi:hypothetical protein